MSDNPQRGRSSGSIAWAGPPAGSNVQFVAAARYGWGRHSVTTFGVGGLIQAAVGLSGGVGGLLTKRSGLFAERLIERDLPGGVNGVDLAVMHLVRGHQADPGMVMVLVVPIEEAAAEASGVLDAAEALGEARLILQGFEVAFGERVVVGGVRPVVRTGDAEIGEQQRGGLGLHRAAAIGVQGELTGRHVVFRDGVVEQRPEQRGAFGIGHAPADHAAAEDVENDVEIEVAPLRWPHQFGDVPGPDLVGTFGQKFGLLVDGMAQLLAAFADLAVLSEDAIHGADRAVVDAFIEQGGVDFGRRLIGEARRVQQIQHHLLLRIGQRPGRLRSLARRSPAARPDGSAGAARWRAKPQARRRPRRSCRGAARVPRRPRSRLVVVGRQRDAQQRRNFFLDVDDGFGARQAQRETGIVASATAATSAASGLGSAVFGPRLAGASAPKAPASRCRRQSVKVDE